MKTHDRNLITLNAYVLLTKFKQKSWINTIFFTKVSTPENRIEVSTSTLPYVKNTHRKPNEMKPNCLIYLQKTNGKP